MVARVYTVEAGPRRPPTRLRLRQLPVVRHLL
jgi:hypothetical protein